VPGSKGHGSKAGGTVPPMHRKAWMIEGVSLCSDEEYAALEEEELAKHGDAERNMHENVSRPCYRQQTVVRVVIGGVI